MAELAALPYLGGKSPLAPQRVGRWIADQLPVTKRYCEPFAGMLGVLLQRPPVAQEVINDIDGRIENWWTVIRDRYQPFCDKLNRTHLLSEFSLRWAEDHLDDEDPVDRALALTIHSVCAHPSGAFRFRVSKNSPQRILTEETVRALADRMRYVTITSRDASALLTKMSKYEDMVFYVDPPYTSAPGHKLYNKHQFDREKLTETLTSLTGYVAVSGYNNEWDHLGWRREMKQTYLSVSAKGDGAQHKRTEVLWMNYDPKGENDTETETEHPHLVPTEKTSENTVGGTEESRT